ncbi:MAG: hypothetical protein HQ581_21200 [Planctomycetes bacterium]|nr:hypothetical protein [Planctomycetota bacterium]
MSIERIIVIITIAVVVTFLITLFYKLIPYRRPREKKPLLALFPKYHSEVDWGEPEIGLAEIEERLAEFGFRKFKTRNGMTFFQRGHLLGDFSIKIVKLKCGISEPENGKSTITLEASWVAGFDTGDLWVFLSELKQKLKRT